MFFRKNILKFNILDSNQLVHGVSTRYFGSIKNKGIINKKNLKNFLSSLNIDINQVVISEQVHGSKVFLANNLRTNLAKNADGLISKKENIFLCVVSADCLPIIFYDRKKGIIGVIHAGYKGLLRGIIKNTINKFIDLGSDTGGIEVAIGPGIEACCYDVPKTRINTFKNSFGDLAVYSYKNEEYFLDLKATSVKILCKNGIGSKNIENSGICTACNIDKFYSFRKEDTETYGEFATVVGQI